MTFVFVPTGTFKLQLEFTEEYPNKPPTVKFISFMFHPNGKFSHRFLPRVVRFVSCRSVLSTITILHVEVVVRK